MMKILDYWGIIEGFKEKFQLERDEVKQIFLSIMNGGSRDGLVDDFL